MHWKSFAACLILFFFAGPLSGAPEPAELEIIRLANKQIFVDITPTGGRILRFGKIGSVSLLWDADAEAFRRFLGDGWFNYGGDKIWPSQQKCWSIFLQQAADWPPDPLVDVSTWQESNRTESSITLLSPFLPSLGITVRREITLDPVLPCIFIRQTLTRMKKNSYPVHIWNITQVKQPEYFLADLATSRPNEFYDVKFVDATTRTPSPEELEAPMENVRKMNLTETANQVKFGLFGNWICARYADSLFLQHTLFEPDGCYPDGANLELFVTLRDGNNYCEMELLSENRHLKVQESLTNEVVWFLADITPEADVTEVLEVIHSSIQKFSSR